MNWDAIGAIGEIVGASAVVITLLYLAKQTRSNARAIDTTSSREFAYRLSEWDREAARDPEIRRILMKSTSSEPEEYSDEEWVAFRFLAISLFRIYETGYLHTYSEGGNLEESANHLISVRSLIDAWPTWKLLWENETSTGAFTAEFINAVNAYSGTTDLSVVIEGHRRTNDVGSDS